MVQGPLGNVEVRGPFGQSFCMVVVRTWSILKDSTVDNRQKRRKELRKLVKRLSFIDGVPGATTTIYYTVHDDMHLYVNVGLPQEQQSISKDNFFDAVEEIEEEVRNVSAGMVKVRILSGDPQRKIEDRKQYEVDEYYKE